MIATIGACRTIPFYNRTGQPITVEVYMKLFSQACYRIVAFAKVGDAEVSTIWLGFDHSSFPGDPPILFETKVLSGAHKGYLVRDSTEAQAQKTHNTIVQQLQANRAPNV